MPRLDHTSVPAWAHRQVAPTAPVATVTPPAPTPGASYLLVGVGPRGADQVADWGDDVAGPATPVARVLGPDLDGVRRPFGDALAAAHVGVRIRLAGPVAACLALRGQAVAAGVEDDEIEALATAGPIDLWCVHCSTTSAVVAAIDDVVTCAGCARNLLVHHHVSRLTGAFLGFQVDAEEAASTAQELAS